MSIRYFAHARLDGGPMQDWGEDPDAAFNARGGGGDELDYDPDSDTFTYSLGGLRWKTMPNPCPGDVLAGAVEVAKQADADWGVTTP